MTLKYGSRTISSANDPDFHREGYDFDEQVDWYADPHLPTPKRRRLGGIVRKILVLLAIIVAIVLFVEILMVAYQRYTEADQATTAPLIRADIEPTRVRPEQPGGMQVPHQDRLVLQDIGDQQLSVDVESIQELPEEPLASALVSVDPTAQEANEPPASSQAAPPAATSDRPGVDQSADQSPETGPAAESAAVAETAGAPAAEEPAIEAPVPAEAVADGPASPQDTQGLPSDVMDEVLDSVLAGEPTDPATGTESSAPPATAERGAGDASAAAAGMAPTTLNTAALTDREIRPDTREVEASAPEPSVQGTETMPGGINEDSTAPQASSDQPEALIPREAAAQPLRLTGESNPPAAVSSTGSDRQVAATDATDLPLRLAPSEPSTRTEAPAALASAAPVADEPASTADATPTVPPAPRYVQATDGTHRVQLAAVGSEAEARDEWQTMSQRFPDLLGGLDLVTPTVQVNDQTWYRVQTGTLGSDDAARLCAEIKARGADCIVRTR